MLVVVGIFEAIADFLKEESHHGYNHSHVYCSVRGVWLHLHHACCMARREHLLPREMASPDHELWSATHSHCGVRCWTLYHLHDEQVRSKGNHGDGYSLSVLRLL